MLKKKYKPKIKNKMRLNPKNLKHKNHIKKKYLLQNKINDKKN